jgi:phage tail tape-measure protein
VGLEVGDAVENINGAVLGAADGKVVGVAVGDIVGSAVGAAAGDAKGAAVGVQVGGGAEGAHPKPSRRHATSKRYGCQLSWQVRMRMRQYL